MYKTIEKTEVERRSRGSGQESGALKWQLKTCGTYVLLVICVFVAIIFPTAASVSYGGSDPQAAYTGSPVLGASAYDFTADIGFGDRGEEVRQLQRVLIADGYLKLKEPTGWFGPLTRAAVRLYQAANIIPATGYVGTRTRAVFSQGAIPVQSKAQSSVLYEWQQVEHVLKNFASWSIST